MILLRGRENDSSSRLFIAVAMSAAVFSAVQALVYPLLAIILARGGAATWTIGINAAMTPLGMLLAAPVFPALAARWSGLRWTVVSLSTTLFCLLMIGATRSPLGWMPLRLVMGMCLCCIFIVSETWINQLAAEARRGRALGLYSTLLSAGFATGPLCLAFAGTVGWAPFFAGTVLILMALVPLLWARRALPPVPPRLHAAFLAFIPRAPLLLICVLIAAIADESALSILPVYLLRNGVGSHAISLLLVVMIAGSISLQFPIGWAADRHNRRSVIAGCALVSAVCSALLAGTADIPLLIAPVLFVWGGAYYGLYTLSLIRLGETFSGPWLTAGNAAFGAMWGLGGLIGPGLLGIIMDWMGPIGFPLAFSALFGGLFLPLAGIRPRTG